MFLFISGSTNDQHPADISVFGDPLKDSDISIKIQTPIQTYNLNLERLNNTLLHKDFTVLNVFTDPTGKTVFHEDSVKVTYKVSHMYNIFFRFPINI
jgi:hypothetical protein